MHSLVFDSWSKIPPGLFRGNRNWLGAADQCSRIESAKYCIANMDMKGLFGGGDDMIANLVKTKYIFGDTLTHFASVFIIISFDKRISGAEKIIFQDKDC